MGSKSLVLAVCLVALLAPMVLKAGLATDPTSIRRLASVIGSKDASGAQKAEASVALVKCGDRAVPSLLGVLASADVGNSRFYAIFALGCLSSPEAVEPLCRLLGDRSYAPRTNAAVALGKIGSPKAVGTLERALSDVWYVRDNAVDALIKIDSPRAREILEDYYFSKSDPRFKLSISCTPVAIGMGDTVEIRASMKNVSQQNAVLQLAGGRPYSTIVIRRRDGAFASPTRVQIADRVRVETHVLKAGDTFRWAVAGEARRLEMPADPCGVPPTRTSSDALVLGSSAFSLSPPEKLRIRLITDVATSGNGGASPAEGKLSTKVISGEASLSTH